METTQYPRVYLDGKAFASLGNFGDKVKVILEGKIVSATESEHSSSITLEVYSAGTSDKDLKDTGIKVANEADKSLAKLESVASPSPY